MIFIIVTIIINPAFASSMPRPPFHLTDQQAALIAQGVMALDARIPIDPRSHRPFVRDFIDLVRSATGKLYSPEIYRRLLDAYAPTRRPSMSTLAAERERAGRMAAHPGPSSDDRPVPMYDPVPDRFAEIKDVVADALEAKLGRVLGTVEQMQNAQVEFYQYQLQEAEIELKALRIQLATLGAELSAARQGADQYRAEAQSYRTAVDKHVQTIELLSRNADDMRKFALMSIEDARGETRAWKDRCGELELQRERDAQAVDAIRRSSYQAAAEGVKEPFK